MLPAGNPTVPGTVISSSGWWNPTGNDLATAITQSLASDGQTIPIANLPMGNFRHTSVANALNRNEYAAYGQVQDGQPQWLTVSGTDTILGTIAPGPTGYVAGQTFRFVAAGANTTNAVTLNINSLGAKNITKNGSNVLSAGDIPSGAVIHVAYDGTQFQVIGIRTSIGQAEFRNLTGKNNSGAPNTKYDFNADSVSFRNPTTGEIVVRTSAGFTNDISVAGPIINGRDQAAAFTAASWIYIYAIWNGTTFASISSAVPPPTGPTLPSGYTHWAFATALRIEGTGNLRSAYTRGNRVVFDIATTGNTRILNGGLASTMTTISMATCAPPIALTAQLSFYLNVTHNVAGVEFVSKYRTTGSSIAGITANTMPTAVAGVFISNTVVVDGIVPSATSTIDYTLNPTPSTAGGVSIDVLGFTIPNGAN